MDTVNKIVKYYIYVDPLLDILYSGRVAGCRNTRNAAHQQK